jgi:hypothetical protein
MPERAMALDLGSRGVGWAWENQSGQIRLDRFDRLPVPARHFAMCDLLSVRLTDWVCQCRPDVVVVEKPFFSRATPTAGVVLYQLLGAAGVVLIRHQVRAELASIFDWQAWAKERGWTKTKGDDANDAQWILKWWEDGAPRRPKSPMKRKAKKPAASRAPVLPLMGV